MLKPNLDQFKMIETVESLMNDNIALWNGFPVLVTAKTALTNYADAIRHEFAKSLVVTTGIAENKSDSRKKLTKQALQISKSMSSYFAINGDDEQYESNYFTPSALQLMKEKELIGTCFHLHKNAETELANLAAFNITAVTLANFMVDIEAFSNQINLPKQAIGVRKEANTQVVNLLSECMRFLTRQLDTAMVMLENSQPTFVGLYRLARRIRNSPTSRRALQIVCVSATTNAPIEGVKLTIVKEKTIRFSGAKGKCYVQHLPQGKHKLLVEFKNTEPQTIDFITVKGIMKEVVVIVNNE
jgi:hypothetical protein